MNQTLTAVSILSIAAVLQAQAPPHHEPPAERPFRVRLLSGNVHVLHGRGGNVRFYVGPDAVLAVDSQYKDLAPGILQQIKKVTDTPVRYLVNTHHHGDHVGDETTQIWHTPIQG